jgi:hypothetical protein
MYLPPTYQARPEGDKRAYSVSPARKNTVKNKKTDLQGVLGGGLGSTRRRFREYSAAKSTKRAKVITPLLSKC